MSSRIVTRSRASASIDEPVARRPAKQTRTSKAVQAKKATADGRRRAAAEQPQPPVQEQPPRPTQEPPQPPAQEQPPVQDQPPVQPQPPVQDQPPPPAAEQPPRPAQEQPQPATPEPPRAQPQAPNPAPRQPVSGQPSTPDEPLANRRFDEDLLYGPRTWIPLTLRPGPFGQGQYGPRMDFVQHTVPTFDSTRKGAYKWLDAFEQAAHANGLEGSALIRVFIFKLDKPAANWAEAQPALSYEELRTRFLARYGSKTRNKNILNTVCERTQKPGEAPSDYYYDLAALNEQASPALNEAQLRSTFIAGLLPSLQPYAKARMVKLHGWDLDKMLEKFDAKAIKLNSKADAPEEARSSSTTQRDSRTSATRSGHSLAVSHGKQSNRFHPYPPAGSDKTGNQKGLCFNCHQPGHIRQNCPNVDQQATSGRSDDKQVVCFSCGQPGHRYRSCPHNKGKPVESGQVTPQDLQQIVDHIKHWVENRDSDKRSSD